MRLTDAVEQWSQPLCGTEVSIQSEKFVGVHFSLTSERERSIPTLGKPLLDQPPG
ncbi:hypothetical protein [Halogeometricum borinquense]|uniref:hypothetical protein n=1 Tax=Halogeometricum borinquense TaxID=60847 RepID=UPI00343DE84C